MSDESKEREKEYIKNYYYKRKTLLNNLINRVEELENVSLNKRIFKCFKSIKKLILIFFCI